MARRVRKPLHQRVAERNPPPFTVPGLEALAAAAASVIASDNAGNMMIAIGTAMNTYRDLSRRTVRMPTPEEMRRAAQRMAQDIPPPVPDNTKEDDEEDEEE